VGLLGLGRPLGGRVQDGQDGLGDRLARAAGAAAQVLDGVVVAALQLRLRRRRGLGLPLGPDELAGRDAFLDLRQGVGQ
jgi:hypothetical protein